MLWDGTGEHTDIDMCYYDPGILIIICTVCENNAGCYTQLLPIIYYYLNHYLYILEHENIVNISRNPHFIFRTIRQFLLSLNPVMASVFLQKWILCFVFVVYFDQQTGAPHTVCWQKSSFQHLTYFSVTKKQQQNKCNQELFPPGVDLCLGIKQHLEVTPKCRQTPF